MTDFLSSFDAVASRLGADLASSLRRAGFRTGNGAVGVSGGNVIRSSSEDGKRAVTTGGGTVSLNDEAGGTEVSMGASGETSATEGSCEAGIGAWVDKSGVVPCRHEGLADKSGGLVVACCDVLCGDAAEVEGALP
jgi:hypothetical protein